jgi:hypothetical protein
VRHSGSVKGRKAPGTDLRITVMVAAGLVGLLAIKVLASDGVLDASVAIALIPIWLMVVVLPGAWLQARAERRPLSLVLRRAISRNPGRWPGPD